MLRKKRTRGPQGSCSAVAKRGFTLVEVVAATAIAGVGIVAAMSTFGAMNAAMARGLETEKMQRIADEKFDEIVATGEVPNTPLSGEVTGTDFVWNAESATTETENVTELIVTVRRSAGREDSGIEVRGLVFILPTSTGAAGGTP
ncbi:MAG: type II secretion system protein [Armatimonadetes bacterium]|nr:type II secretion system protein [Armatimonadota bacterium]